MIRPSLSCLRSSLLSASNQAQPCSTTERTQPRPEPCGSPFLRMRGRMPSRRQSHRLSALS